MQTGLTAGSKLFSSLAVDCDKLNLKNTTKRVPENPHTGHASKSNFTLICAVFANHFTSLTTWNKKLKSQSPENHQCSRSAHPVFKRSSMSLITLEDLDFFFFFCSIFYKICIQCFPWQQYLYFVRSYEVFFEETAKPISQQTVSHIDQLTFKK